MIEFDKVSKSYGAVQAIDALDLQVSRGEFVVLIGASGSGKSTVLKMINRMENHDTGQILFDGRDIGGFKVRDLRLRMGYAIQSVGLFPHWTVERNIACVPQMLGWTKARIANRVNTLLQLFDLDPDTYRRRFPHELSGGQQQRVGVARALAADPDVLLMDEPFGALDPVIRASLQAEMKRVHRASGKTIVMVTHDIDEALHLATRIVLLDRGKIMQTGSPLELLAAPATSFVVDFVGRSDIGIKLLSLQQAGSVARVEPPLEGSSGAALSADASLREAVSLMATQRLQAVNLVTASGAHAGVLHAVDIFNQEGQRSGDKV
ncbi:MAG: transporter related protein [Polaromonas sp.]|jgi:osmoprotectant transport system ATP-binding protein|nr:transporter related protein [Polaromonas sp.]